MAQQDVQELNRILFSALESSLIGTSGSSLIQRLYHGTLINVITCNECHSVSERQVCVVYVTLQLNNNDKYTSKRPNITSFSVSLFHSPPVSQEDFLDLTVCVRGVSSLEEALWSMFVEEEVFEGNNLYRCSHCDQLVNATKVIIILNHTLGLRY